MKRLLIGLATVLLVANAFAGEGQWTFLGSFESPQGGEVNASFAKSRQSSRLYIFRGGNAYDNMATPWILRSDNDGMTWQTLNGPALPTLPSFHPPKPGEPPVVGQFYLAPEFDYDDSSGALYFNVSHSTSKCGYTDLEESQILGCEEIASEWLKFVSKDKGMSWASTPTIPGNLIPLGRLAISPLDPKIQWMVPEVNPEVPEYHPFGKTLPLLSQDGGATWQIVMKGLPTADIEGAGSIAFDPGDPTRVYFLSNEQGLFEFTMPSSSSTLSGDVNHDGKVTLADAILVLRLAVGLPIEGSSALLLPSQALKNSKKQSSLPMELAKNSFQSGRKVKMDIH